MSKLNPDQFDMRISRIHGGGKPFYSIGAFVNDERIGVMSWGTKAIRGMHVEEEHRRKGVATAMWEHAHEVAGARSDMPMPKHSGDRTDDGDAWARSVGGRLPRRGTKDQ